jgi:hypothetical protein
VHPRQGRPAPVAPVHTAARPSAGPPYPWLRDQLCPSTRGSRVQDSYRSREPSASSRVQRGRAEGWPPWHPIQPEPDHGTRKARAARRTSCPHRPSASGGTIDALPSPAANAGAASACHCCHGACPGVVGRRRECVYENHTSTPSMSSVEWHHNRAGLMGVVPRFLLVRCVPRQRLAHGAAEARPVS